MDVGKLWVQLGINDDNFNKGIHSAENKSKGLGQSLKGALTVATGNMISSAANGIMDIGKNALGAGFNYNSMMEQAETAFGTMLGSTDEAKKLIGELSNYAATTPFEFEGIANAQKTLMQFGLSAEDSTGMMKMLGDISMGDSQKMQSLSLAMGQVSSSGKLQGQDLMQLINAGFNPLQEISKRTGESMESLKDKMSKGQISYEMVADSMANATGEGGQFNGMTAAMGETFDGKVSTMKDTWDEFCSVLMSGAFDWVKDAIQSVTDVLGDLTSAVKDGDMVGALKALFPDDLVDDFLNALEKVKTFFSDWGGIIGGAALAVGLLTLAMVAGKVAYEIHFGVLLVGEGITKGFAAVQALLNGVMALNPFVLVAIAVVAVVTALVILWNKNEGFRNFIMQCWESIKGIFGSTIDSIKSTWDSLSAKIEAVWNYILPYLTTAWETIKNVATTVFEMIKNVISTVWENIKNVISAVWEIIKTVVETAIGVVLGIISTVMKLIDGDWQGAWEAIKGVASTLWEGIKEVISTAIDLVKSVISNTLETVKGIMSNAWDTIKDVARNAWDALKDVVSNAWDKVKQSCSDAVSNIGKVVSGIKDKITKPFKDAWSFISDIPGKISSAFSNMHISLPHINLPHFSISGEFSLMPPSVPKLDIDWRAKGGIFNGPSIIGVGEAGAEAVLPINKLSGILAETLNKTGNFNIVDKNEPLQKIEINFNGSYSFANEEQITDFMNKASRLITRRLG